jgi:ATP-dependent Clp protease ATP-binding subunit ClpA
MFERFTSDARQTVVGAQIEARRLHDGRIGTQHLLLALLTQDTPTTAVLARHGLTHDAVAETIRGYGGDDLDADALTTLGIDLDAVRERVEATFGPGALDGTGRRDEPPGHIPFSPRAKKVLELALREAIAGRSKSIRDGHIALGLLREGEGLAMKALHDRGVDPAALRRDLSAALAS